MAAADWPSSATTATTIVTASAPRRLVQRRKTTPNRQQRRRERPDHRHAANSPTGLRHRVVGQNRQNRPNTNAFQRPVDRVGQSRSPPQPPPRHHLATFTQLTPTPTASTMLLTSTSLGCVPGETRRSDKQKSSGRFDRQFGLKPTSRLTAHRRWLQSLPRDGRRSVCPTRRRTKNCQIRTCQTLVLRTRAMRTLSENSQSPAKVTAKSAKHSSGRIQTPRSVRLQSE